MRYLLRFSYTPFITYRNLLNTLQDCIPAELAMPVQALYDSVTRYARGLSYCWAADGTVLLSLDCCPGGQNPISYNTLLGELRALCSWQLDGEVVVALPTELVEVLTVYHDMDREEHGENTLLLVSTPPHEYFEAIAA